MNHTIISCKISDWGCVYHACLSDHCQKRFVLKYNSGWGTGNCRKKKSKPIS